MVIESFSIMKWNIVHQVIKLGHLSISVKDAPQNVDFYHRILGFRKTDRILTLANSLTCNEDHDTLNIIQGKKSYMHHIAFQLRNPGHQYASSDILMRHNNSTIWGPSRHTAGHNITSYHLDPDKNVIELLQIWINLFPNSTLWSRVLGIIEL